MNKYTGIIEKLLYSFSKISEESKKPRDYGTGHMLYQSEIHAIFAVKNHREANASELAKVLGVTNGAVTQVIHKLIKKGLVQKYSLNNNKKEVYFKLTEDGEIAFRGHEKYHEESHAKVLKYLDGLESEKIQAISDFFDKFNEYTP